MKRLLALFGILGLAAAGVSYGQRAADADDNDPASLRAEIERLQSIMPGQAVAMTQVAYNFNNLWFAAHAENWPLAQFYLGDGRGRLRWALRIQPTRRTANGELVLQPLLDALEKNELTKLGEAVASHDIAAFETAYSATLGACHACHTAAEKPYLDVQVPTAPAEPMMHFAPR
jgi:hypothetical protein